MSDAELDMDAIVERVRAAGFPAYVEQTGGGCATVYAGPPDADGASTPEPARGARDYLAIHG